MKVTLEFHKVSDGLPEKKGSYIILTEYSNLPASVSETEYDPETGKFGYFSLTSKRWLEPYIKPTMWAEKPQELVMMQGRFDHV